MRKALLIFGLGIITISGFGQYKSLIESPLYIKGKRNFYQDTVSKLIMPIEHLDSLYKEKRNRPFHVFGQVTKSDSVIWEVAFFDAESVRNDYRAKWINQTFPLKNFKAIDGRLIEKKELEGRNLIINCWSITCGPCIKEIPQLNLLVDSLKKNDFSFLALTFDKSVPINSFLKSGRLKDFLNIANPEFKFDIIPDQEVLLTNILNVHSYPTTFIVDKNGKIRDILEGVNLDKEGQVKTYAEIIQAIQVLHIF